MSARIRLVLGALLGAAALVLLTVVRGSSRLDGDGPLAAVVGGALLLAALAVIAWDR